MLLLSYKTSRRIACIHGAAFIPTEGIQELDTYITGYVTAPANTDETDDYDGIFGIVTFTLPLALPGERCKLMCDEQWKEVMSRIAGRRYLQMANR